ncbi:MAG: nucleoside-diphosphate kinase [Deltaproteobacteria bacterium]|nr:nucleoside-diphosphate kinase [Deltaproteobacteria bacterium]
MERTFAIIKPDAVEKNLAGKIVAHIEGAGFRIVSIKKLHMTTAIAGGFYAEHSARGFFGELVAFMSRSPCFVMCLESEDAVKKWRDTMGATNPANAADGTIRKLFGGSVGENATHGSDSAESAARELAYFFAGLELL